MTAPLCFLDTETTGLDPDAHEVWEVAAIIRRPGEPEVELEWQLPVDVGRAEAMGLRVGNFYGRRWSASSDGDPAPTAGYPPLAEAFGHDGRRVVANVQMARFAQTFARLTWDCHLVGAVVSFDEERLRRLLRRHGACPGWHYHLVDVENLAAGWVAARAARPRGKALAHEARPPWSSDKLSALVGVEPSQFGRHTALGDARWARAIYDAVIEGGAP